MRGSVKRGVRVVMVVVVLSMIWLQLALPPLPHELPAASSDSMEPDPSLGARRNTPLHALMQQLVGNKEEATPALTQAQIWELWERVLEHSVSETIHNSALFGSVQPDTVVIVVQVHNRLEYLRHLIVSLAEVRNIEAVLLIFSQDYYDETINKLIMTIDFCKVMQVFYPHTLQLHPTGFPGHTEGDCPRDTNPKIARQLQCRGNPDLYGHYREPRYTQTKHHWWWKANKVFDSVLSPFNHTGLVLFLEEDHYVSEDLLHMLALLSAALPHACPHCSLLTLGNYLRNYNWPADAKKVEISPWLSSKHNMGFAFNRSTWHKIQACGSGFCTHDDYNWDWSLQHVSNSCLRNRLHTMVLRAPRVFHIGECGVHHKKKDCSSKLVLNKVYRTLQTARRALFPLKLIIMHAPPKKLKKHKGNGGWGDHRDQELCKSFMHSTGPYHPLVREPTPVATAPPSPDHNNRSYSTSGTENGVMDRSRHDDSADGGEVVESWAAHGTTVHPKVFPDIHPKLSKKNVLTLGNGQDGGSSVGKQTSGNSKELLRNKIISRMRKSISPVGQLDGDDYSPLRARGAPKHSSNSISNLDANNNNIKDDDEKNSINGIDRNALTESSILPAYLDAISLSRRDLKVSSRKAVIADMVVSRRDHVAGIHPRPSETNEATTARVASASFFSGSIEGVLTRISPSNHPGGVSVFSVNSDRDSETPASIISLPYYIDPRHPLNPFHSKQHQLNPFQHHPYPHDLPPPPPRSAQPQPPHRRRFWPD